MAYRPEKGFSFGDVLRHVSIPKGPAVLLDDKTLEFAPGVIQDQQGVRLLGVRLPDHAVSNDQVRDKTQKKRYQQVGALSFEINSDISSHQALPVIKEKPPLVLEGREDMDPNDLKGGRAQAKFDELLHVQRETGARVIYESRQPIEERLKETEILMIKTNDGETLVFDCPSSLAHSPKFRKLLKQTVILLGNEAKDLLGKIINVGPQVMELVSDIQEKIKAKKAEIAEEKQLRKINRAKKI